MYLTRYVISKKNEVLEIEPDTGFIIKRCDYPDDLKLDPYRKKAHWEEYDGKIFLLYMHKGNMIFQEGMNRFNLDSTFSSYLYKKSFRWKVFELYQNDETVYKFTYQDPHTRLRSLFFGLFCQDDWWDWDTPFDDAHNYLNDR